MAGNHALVAVKDHGWMSGFSNLFRRENQQWWGTWQWLIQVLIWMAIINGMLAMVTLAAPKIEAAQARREINNTQVAEAR